MNFLKHIKTFAPLRLCGILLALGSLSNHAQTINDFQFGICGDSGNYEVIAPNGYHYVESSTREITQPDKSDEDFAKHLNNLLAKKRNILVINGFISIKVVGPEKDHDAALAYAIKVFDRAKLVGVKKIIFGSQGSRTAPKDYPYEQAYKEFTDFLKLIVPEAKKRGLIISLEPLTNCTLMPKIEQAARMCEDVKAPNVLGITPDFWHMINNKDAPQNLVKYAKHIKHIHLAEQNGRTPPGVNNQDLSPYWNALAQSGYTGLISFEGLWPKSHPLKVHHPKALQLMKEGLQKALD